MSSESNEVIMAILEASFPEATDMQFTINSIDQRDQNYTSDITYLSANYKRDHQNHQIDLAIKIPKERHQSSFYEKMDFFIREASTYDIMLPLVHQSLGYPLAPLHYRTIDSRILVLEDLSKQGYQSRDKCDILNLEHSLAILKTLSHFHAATYKVHQTHPHLLSEAAFQRSAITELRRNVASTWELPFCDLLRKNGASSLMAKFAAAVSFLRQDDDVIIPKIKQSNFDFVVLNHGDFRLSNILFKYGSKDTVESVKMIDFQTCMWSSPAVDVIYFLTTSVRVEVVQQYFHILLDWYLRCLNEKLEQLGCARTYSKDHFMEDFDKLKFLTLLGALCVGSIMCPQDKSQQEAIFMVDEKEKTSSSAVSVGDEHLIYSWLKFCQQMKVFDVDGSE